MAEPINPHASLSVVENPPVFAGRFSRVSVRWDSGARVENLLALGLELPESLIGAVDSRKIEFLAGRFCAVQALAETGCRNPVQPPVNEDRSPCWPVGYVGSITHKGGYASAVVAERSSVAGVGIDSENLLVADTSDRIARYICSAPELGAAIPEGLDRKTLLTIIFSAKESIFKCLYPVIGRYLGFKEAELASFYVDSSLEQGVVEFTLAHSALDALAAIDAPDGKLSVEWCVYDGLVHTGISIR